MSPMEDFELPEDVDLELSQEQPSSANSAVISAPVTQIPPSRPVNKAKARVGSREPKSNGQSSKTLISGIDDPSIQILPARSITGEEDIQLRAAISEWANRIPHHPHRDFGEVISISEARFLPIYDLRLQSLHESRRIDARQEPYRNRPVPSVSTPVSDPWTLSLAAQKAFETKSLEHRLEQSYQVSPCDGCNAQGILTCGTCNGSGGLTCGNCNRGEVKCRSCGGGGLCPNCGRMGHRRHPVNVNQWDTCYRCNGKGMCLECSASGTQNCLTCNGNGIVKCHGCNGVGRMQCGKCEGACKLLNFQVCVRKFTFKTASKTLSLQAVPKQLSSIVASSHDYVRNASSEGDIDHTFASRISDSTLQVATQTLLSDPTKSPQGGEHIVYRQLDLERLPIYQLKYDHEGENFEMFLHGSRLNVLATRSPISRVGQELEAVASKQAAAGSHREALEGAIKALEINPSSRKARDVIGKIQTQLTGYSILAAFMVTVAATIIAYIITHDVGSIIGSMLGGLVGFGIVCLPWFRAATAISSRLLIGALLSFGPSLMGGVFFHGEFSILGAIATVIGFAIVMVFGGELFDMPKLRNAGVSKARPAPVRKGGGKRE